MKRTTGEDDPCAWDRDDLCSVAAAEAISERGAAVHRHGLMPTEQRAVSHEEVRLHPAVPLGRYRNRRRVVTIQGRSPTTIRSPFGGGGARRTCAATRSMTSRNGCAPSAPRSVIVRFERL